LKAWHDECGVFGIWNHPQAAHLTYLGLYALQHRGQESAGIVSLEGKHHHVRKGLGLVAEVFNDETLNKMPGSAAIGHVRYSTTGMNLISNAQPITGDLAHGPVAVAHNGNIVNAQYLRNELRKEGAIFQGTSDTEVLLHMVAHDPRSNLVDCLSTALEKIEGAFSFAILSDHSMIAIRDPWGFRPLVIGTLNGAYVVASETCAFDLIGAKLVREIQPGEIFWVDEAGEHSVFMKRKAKRAACVFEHVYFARPDSVVFGQSVYEVRKRAGQILARETAVEIDMVIPVPDSGVPAAIGYSTVAKVPFELGIIRNHYIGRTFIQPQQSIRDFGVKIKLNPQSAILQGKRVVIVDDSLVRGTTSRKIVGLVRAAGAKEVHLRIAAPPTTGPCYYGVDTPEKSQLIAANQSLEEIRKFVGADTLGYLSLAGLSEAVNNKDQSYCNACFDGKYPTPLFGLDQDPKGNIRGK
jgi:amidophosphoribosyltransferase